MRKIAWLAGVVTLLASGSYVFVYLHRWEWHRALIVGVLFVAAEVAFGTALILRRLARSTPAGESEGLPRGSDGVADPQPWSRRPEFAWLRGDGGFGVFIPVLIGSGVIVSAVAWIVERVAARGSAPSARRGAAADMAPLAFPESLLVEHPEVATARGEEEDRLALLVRPHGGRRPPLEGAAERRTPE